MGQTDVFRDFPLLKEYPESWYSLESIVLLSQRWMDMLTNKRLGRPVTYTFTQFVAECRKKRPEIDTALVRGIAKELWKEYGPDGQPGPAVPP